MNDVGMVPNTLPPDPALEQQQKLQRAQMMGQMLQQPDTGQMVGKHYVGPNPQNQMLKLLGAYLSGGRQMPGAQPTQESLQGVMY